MSEWSAKRFWKASEVTQTDGGYAVTLDGRTVNTPGKTPLIVPTLEMAAAIAAEWDAQTGKVDPTTMPATRAANSAIDKVAFQKTEVANLLSDYGGSDLLCYRAFGPDALVALQAAAWDPVLDWAAEALDARLSVRQGVMHIKQPANALQNLATEVDRLGNFALTGFHDLVSLSGSLVLALAVTHQHIDARYAWRISRVDEDWQISQWGEDDDATATELIKRSAFEAAERFYRMSVT